MFQKKNYIYAVYQTKSFSKAAEKLFISQPSLSAMVKKEEQRMNAQIFDRSKSPIALTSFGQKYITALEKINAMETELVNYINDENGLFQGTFSLGCNSVYMSYVLPRFMAQFTTQYPNIQMTLTESNADILAEKIAMDRLDLILDNKDLDNSSFAKTYFTTEYLLLAVPSHFPVNQQVTSHRLTRQQICADIHASKRIGHVPLELFQDCPFIIMTQGNDTRDRNDQIFDYFGIRPKILLELDQLAAVYHVASSGAACCIVSDALIKNFTAPTDNVCFYTLPTKFARRDVFFQYKKHRYLPKSAATFMDICVEK